MTKEQLLKRFEKELIVHDEWYMMTEDFSVYQKGLKQKESLDKLVSEALQLGLRDELIKIQEKSKKVVYVF